MQSQATLIMVNGPAKAAIVGSATRSLSGIALRIVVRACFAVACLSLNAASGGGTVNFANSSSTLVINGQTGTPVRGEGILVAVYWAPQNSSNFVQIGAPVFVGGLIPGRFAAGTRMTGPDTPGGSNARFQVRAWDWRFTTYEQALASNGVFIGQSSTFQVKTGDPTGVPPAIPPTPPASLLAGGLSSFRVTNHFFIFPPGITANPTNQSVQQGRTAVFSVSASGTPPLAYQWFKDGTNPLAGQTAEVLSLSNVQSNDAGGYSVVVTNAYGSTNSSIATLTVLFPPVIVQQPQNRATVTGGSAQFSVGTTGSNPLTYQWQHPGAELVDGTNRALNLTNIQGGCFGEYRVVVSNLGGSTTSSPAQLTPAVRPLLAEPELNLSTVYLSFPSEIGPQYEIEYKNTLADSNWQSLATLIGTGRNLYASDNNVPSATRFYRVRVR